MICIGIWTVDHCLWPPRAPFWSLIKNSLCPRTKRDVVCSAWPSRESPESSSFSNSNRDKPKRTSLVFNKHSLDEAAKPDPFPAGLVRCLGKLGLSNCASSRRAHPLSGVSLNPGAPFLSPVHFKLRAPRGHPLYRLYSLFADCPLLSVARDKRTLPSRLLLLHSL